MNYRDATWVAVGLQLLAVEVFALVRGDALLTDSIRAGATRWMLWPAIFGALSGHFYGSRGGPAWGPWLLAGLGALVLLRDLLLRDRIPSATHLEVLLVFLGLGAWLWGSR